jgi:hypothetical protein
MKGWQIRRILCLRRIRSTWTRRSPKMLPENSCKLQDRCGVELAHFTLELLLHSQTLAQITLG